MVYRTKWVPLADVLDMLKGVSGDELASKTDICGAIADREIRIRAIVHRGIDPTPASYHLVRRLDLLRADVAIHLVTPAGFENLERLKARQNASAEERESEAIEFLSKRLRNDNLMTREEAKEALKGAGFDFAVRAFQSRMWPAARQMAGLPQKAPSGRPRKRPPLILD